MQNIYWERQRSGLCRLHSLNAYFGKLMYSTSDFWELADEFDERQNDMFGVTTSCRNFDLVNSDQRNLITFVLSKNKIYSRYISINSHKDSIDDAEESGSFFVYNFDHIWIMSKHNNIWYKIDSMSGVSKYNISRLGKEKNIGLIIPIKNTHNEFMKLAAKMKMLVGNDVETFLREQNQKEKNIGELEIILGAIIEVLRVQLNERTKWSHVSDLIYYYDEFTKELSKGNYNKLSFVLQHIVPIIEHIYQIVGYSL